MKNRYEEGSTLVLVVIIIAVVILLGTSILSITMAQYKIRKSNSDLKRAFYMSEKGLNQAYMNVYDLIDNACEDSIYKSNEYLQIYPEDIVGAINVFKINYKQYLIKNAENRIYSTSNPTTNVLNSSALIFVNEKLIIKVKSRYLSEKGIEKITVADIIVEVPDYLETQSGETDCAELLYFNSFDF